jgi:hypothetical protein
VSSTYLQPTAFQSLGSAVEKFYLSAGPSFASSGAISMEEIGLQLQAYSSLDMIRFPIIDGLSTMFF